MPGALMPIGHCLCLRVRSPEVSALWSGAGISSTPFPWGFALAARPPGDCNGFATFPPAPIGLDCERRVGLRATRAADWENRAWPPSRDRARQREGIDVMVDRRATGGTSRPGVAALPDTGKAGPSVAVVR